MRRAEEYHLPHTTSRSSLLTGRNVRQSQVELDTVANDDVPRVHFLNFRIRETVDQLHQACRDPNELGIEVDLDKDTHMQRLALLQFGAYIRHEGRSCGLFERHDDLLLSERITKVIRHAARVSIGFLELIGVRTCHEELSIFILAFVHTAAGRFLERLFRAKCVRFIEQTRARVNFAIASFRSTWVDVWISVVAVVLVEVEPLRSRTCKEWISCAAVAVAIIVKVKRKLCAFIGLPVAVLINVVARLRCARENLLSVRVCIRIIIAVRVRGGCTNGHVTCFDLLCGIAVAIAIVVLEKGLFDIVVVDQLVAIVVEVVANFRITREALGIGVVAIVARD